MSRTGPEPGEQLHASVPRAGRASGSVLIAVAAWLLTLTGGGALFVSFAAQYAYILAVRRQGVASAIEALLLDLLMIVFTLLALGLARAGQSSRAERALILACAAASAYMNVSAADVASPRSVAAYAVAPVALAVVVDRVVAVIHRPRPSRRRALGLGDGGPRRGDRSQDHRPDAAVRAAVRSGRAGDSSGPAPDGPGRRPAARPPEAARVRDDRTAPYQEGRLARPVPGPPGLRGPQHSQPGRCRTGAAGRTAARHRPQLPVRRAGRQDIMTAAPPADPSPRALGESLAALAAQVAALRGQIRAINERLDQAGLRADLNLAARFEDLAQTVADALEAAAPHGPAAPHWIGLDPDTYQARLAELRRWADTVLRQHYGGYELRDCWPAISTPSGNCPPWPPNGVAPTAGHTPTWPGHWSSTTAGYPAPCAASPASPAHASRNA